MQLIISTILLIGFIYACAAMSYPSSFVLRGVKTKP